ncbi:ketosynthase chain-length factor [Natronosporangium hydrolyticum]|uniref:Ketosynthase chain-length factor n=1 Tax=Natronosporangium hydrolyticum TaxID=2811111 RepID=A0A895YMK4_9ACTN|nr:ketosynthase chain-length factor [Natronosporangium hydrolyticum]
MAAEAAVITGLGVIAPTGATTDVYWKATLAGECAIGRLQRYDPSGYPLALAGEVKGFDAEQLIESRLVVQTDRFTQFALAAAELALQDAGLDPADLPPFEIGVVTASCAGGVEFGQQEIEALWRQGSRFVGPYQSIAWFYAASTGQISIRHGLKGPCGVLVTDEAGALDAIAHARRDLRAGAVAMLAGGAEAPFAPFSMTCQYGTGLLSTATDPVQGYRPFTATAAGFVPAEGGAMVVLETAAAARTRGLRGYAAVAGYGTTFTGGGGPAATAGGLVLAARQALAQAEIAPEEVDVVFADALGVPAADQAEVAALRELFGARAAQVPVTAAKAGTGRAYAGAAAIDVAAAALTVAHGVVPPTPNVSELAYDLDLVIGEPRVLDARTALIWARGLSGTNSALVIRACG